MREKRKTKLPPWAYVRKLLKPRFEAAGIYCCELKTEKFADSQGNLLCKGTNFGTFAHSMKVRYRKYPFEMEEVIKACQPCHQVIEAMSAESMLTIVRNKIKSRRVPVEPIFKR
jgi:hypothetical protein